MNMNASFCFDSNKCIAIVGKKIRIRFRLKLLGKHCFLSIMKRIRIILLLFVAVCSNVIDAKVLNVFIFSTNVSLFISNRCAKRMHEENYSQRGTHVIDADWTKIIKGNDTPDSAIVSLDIFKSWWKMLCNLNMVQYVRFFFFLYGKIRSQNTIMKCLKRSFYRWKNVCYFVITRSYICVYSE